MGSASGAAAGRKTVLGGQAAMSCLAWLGEPLCLKTSGGRVARAERSERRWNRAEKTQALAG
ncbi:MAG TPA: hypothetical protein V6C65_14865 [Allocoleopsis sp.]